MPPPSKVILGVDPGLATTGWGVIENGGGTTTLVAYGAIQSLPQTPLPERLRHIQRQLTLLIQTYRPAVMAIEELFFTKFARSIAATAQARGVILLTAAEQGVVLKEYNPRAVKMALTGFGSADKGQMQSMVQRVLGLRERPCPDDAADALAMALCHVHTLAALVPARVTKADFEADLLRRAGVHS